jgi:hypothetical protein
MGTGVLPKIHPSGIRDFAVEAPLTSNETKRISEKIEPSKTALITATIPSLPPRI